MATAVNEVGPVPEVAAAVVLVVVIVVIVVIELIDLLIVVDDPVVAVADVDAVVAAAMRQYNNTSQNKTNHANRIKQTRVTNYTLHYQVLANYIEQVCTIFSFYFFTLTCW